MKVASMQVFKTNLPFKKRFATNQIVRDRSDSVFVKVQLEDGIVGWGESLPRSYVTGETQESVAEEILKNKRKILKSYKKFEDINLPKMGNCATCAVELAILDALGKHFGKGVSSMLMRKKEVVSYSGAFSIDSSILSVIKQRLFGFKAVKVKVSKDISIVRKVRMLMGDVDIRVDANCAWSVDEALAKINILKKYNVSAVEQPVRSLKELNEVASRTDMPIIADESLCSIDDAKKLKNVIFNIRLSKCGGLMKSKEIYDYAQGNSIKCMMGCHVGESAILSAAGRHFALGTQLLHAEGSYGTHLLVQDVGDVGFTKGGIGKPINGLGLGVEVDEQVVRKYS